MMSHAQITLKENYTRVDNIDTKKEGSENVVRSLLNQIVDLFFSYREQISTYEDRHTHIDASFFDKENVLLNSVGLIFAF